MLVIVACLAVAAAEWRWFARRLRLMYRDFLDEGIKTGHNFQ